METLPLLADGLATEQVAARLGVAVETARNHIRAVLRELDAHSRLEAVMKGQEPGLLARADLTHAGQTPEGPAGDELGKRAEELEGRRHADFLGLAAAADDAVRIGSLGPGATYEIDHPVRSADGQEVWLRLWIRERPANGSRGTELIVQAHGLASYTRGRAPGRGAARALRRRVEIQSG